MEASGAHLWRIFSFVQIAAIPAPPDDLSCPLENTALFQIVGQISIALAMLFFGDGHGVERFRDLLKTFFPCYFGKSGIHLGPFMFFTSCSGPQIFEGIPNRTGGK